MDSEDKNFDFDVKIKELQAIVDKLESDVSLEESMRLFENGITLTKTCIDELNRSQESIAALKKQLDTILLSAPEGDNE